MTEATRTRRRRRRALWIIVPLIVILLILASTRTLIRQGVEHSQVSAAANEAAAAIADRPGVMIASAEVDTDIKSRRELRRELWTGRTKPDGEVTVSVSLGRDVTAEDLASVMITAREQFRADTFDRYDVALDIRIGGTDSRLFDGWNARSDGPVHDDKLVADAAALTLDLAPGTWVDLNPATYEQGPFLRGSPTFHALLGMDPAQAITVATMVDAVAAEGFLAEVAALEARVTDALDVAVGFQVRSPGILSDGPHYSEVIFVSDAAPTLRAVWGSFAEDVVRLRGTGIAANIVISTTRNVERQVGNVTLSTFPLDLEVELHDRFSDCVGADPRFADAARDALHRLRATDFAFSFVATACGGVLIDEERPRL